MTAFCKLLSSPLATGGKYTGEPKGKTMKDDLDKYISRRKKRDGKFAESFESGYQELKVGAFATRPETPLAVENSVGKLAAN